MPKPIGERQCEELKVTAVGDLFDETQDCIACAKLGNCVACEGSGRSSRGDECPICYGSGKRREG